MMMWMALALAETIDVCPSCPVTDLDSALAAASAGDEIRLQGPGPYPLSGGTLPFSVAIVGTETSPTRVELSQTLSVGAGGQLTMTNLELAGTADTLVSIDALGAARLTDVHLPGHDAGATSAFVTSGVLELDQAVLDDVTSTGDGAVVHARGGARVTVRASQIARCAAVDGGGIRVVDSELTLSQVTFDGCSAAVGGAVAASDSTLTFDEVSVVNGTATIDGAAVYAARSQLTWFDGVVCDATGPNQLALLNSQGTLASMTLRDGPRAVQLDGGALVATHLDLLGNGAIEGGALYVTSATAQLTDSVVAFQQGGPALFATSNGTIDTSFSSFWSNASDGVGAPGTNPILTDPLLTWPGASCQAAERRDGSPLPSSGSDGRGVGDTDFVPPAPDTGVDTGRPVDTVCNGDEPERRCHTGDSAVVLPTGINNDMTGRLRDSSAIDTGTPPLGTETGSDQDSGPVPVHTGPSVLTGDTAPPDLSDQDSGPDDTAPPVVPTADTGGPNDQDPVPTGWFTGVTGLATGGTGASPTPTGLTASTGDTGATARPTPTGETGTPSPTAHTGDTGTEGPTDSPTEPTDPGGGDEASGRAPGFACTSVPGASGSWWAVAALLVVFARRRTAS